MEIYYSYGQPKKKKKKKKKLPVGVLYASVWWWWASSLQLIATHQKPIRLLFDPREKHLGNPSKKQDQSNLTTNVNLFIVGELLLL
jgi:hypothetical protein